jgi:hypothetical protein
LQQKFLKDSHSKRSTTERKTKQRRRRGRRRMNTIKQKRRDNPLLGGVRRRVRRS